LLPVRRRRHTPPVASRPSARAPRRAARGVRPRVRPVPRARAGVESTCATRYSCAPGDARSGRRATAGDRSLSRRRAPWTIASVRCNTDVANSW